MFAPVASATSAAEGLMGAAADAHVGWLLAAVCLHVAYNPLAAVPSLHVGVAAAIGVALFIALRAPWAKALALLWGPTVALAVLATGNHYLFDIAAGLLVTLAGFGAARLTGRLSRARVPRALRRAARSLGTQPEAAKP